MTGGPSENDAARLRSADAASPTRRGQPTRHENPTEPVGWRLWAVFLSLATFTQIAFKWGGTDLETLAFGWEWVGTLLRSPAVGLAVLGYIVMFGVWLHILQRTSLARAFVMTGLVYITVPLAAALIFNEKIGWQHAAGIALIIAGIALMGPAGSDSASPDA